jgi:uncharacterized protein YjbI with pentapeptide repeats
MCFTPGCEYESLSDEDDCCIFHSSDTLGKSGLFDEAFKKEYQKQSREPQFNFRAFIFPDNFDISRFFCKKTVEKNIDFGLAIFSNAIFRFSRFMKGVDFEGTIFKNGGNFYGAEFLNYVNFKNAVFNNKVIFSRSKFHGDVNFYHAIFKEEGDFSFSSFHDVVLDYSVFETTNFKAAKFIKKISLKYAIFNGDANFEDVDFAEKSDFFCANFKKEAKFDFAKFKEVEFSKTDFKDKSSFWFAEFLRAQFHWAKFSNVIFNSAKFKEENSSVSFRSAQFLGNTELFDTLFNGNADFSSAQFKGNVNFTYVVFNKLAMFNNASFDGKTNLHEDINFNFYELKGTYFFDLENLLEKIVECRRKRTINNIVNFYPTVFRYFLWPFDFVRKILKKKPISELTEFVTADINPQLGEKTVQRYPIIARKIKDDNYLLHIKEKHPVGFCWWWFLSDCGRSFSRWAFWGIVFIILFAAIYSPAPNLFGQGWNSICNKIGPQFEQNIGSLEGQPLGFWSALYLSIITFTSFGFDNVSAINITAKILACFEIVLGYVMLGGLISIFSTRLSQRS